ncbi:MAG: hypothetical protein HY074_10835, partial [Deltaproteobacteria bacterium]|nr:hypothetical protein [Deltaproteobacteria bacterium]
DKPVHQLRVSLGRRVFDVRMQMLHADAGRLLMFEDVSHLIIAEEKLEHARKLVLAGNMSAQVAHEVRNPLNSMRLQLEMLQEDLAAIADASGCGQRVSAIADQVDRLERITRRYLDVGRTQSKRREPVDLNAVVEKSVQFLSRELQAAQIVVELRLADGECEVGGDSDAVSQVLFNLVRNAIEALRERSGVRRLVVTTWREAEVVRCRISDSGPGIAPELVGRIFEPFVTNKVAGHGLGLSVSRQICIEHGGEMKLLPSADGATFEFSIPRMEVAQRDYAPNPDC